MCASKNNFFKEKIALKEYNTNLANMIINLKSYITQLQNFFPFDSISTAIATSITTPIVTNFYYEQKISDLPLFAGN